MVKVKLGILARMPRRDRKEYVMWMNAVDSSYSRRPVYHHLDNIMHASSTSNTSHPSPIIRAAQRSQRHHANTRIVVQ